MATVSPALHKNIKYSLADNVRVIMSLRSNPGLKLVFNVTTGKFSTEKYALIRTMGNLFKSGDSDSATNKNCFEYPLLITFYELKKLQLNIASGKSARYNSDKEHDLNNPLELFQYGSKSKTDKEAYGNRLMQNGSHLNESDPYKALCDGLISLQSNSYQAPNKRPQRESILAILTKASQLNKAKTQPQLDNLLAGLIPFVIPEDIKNKVSIYISFLKDIRAISIPDIDVLKSTDIDFTEKKIRILSAYIYKYLYFGKYYKHQESTNAIKLPRGAIKLPRGVKNIYGIDISTAVKHFHQGYSIVDQTSNILYSYETVRCGLIAKGLINSAATPNSNLLLINQDTCSKNLALVFSQAGEKFMYRFNMAHCPVWK